MLLDLLRYSTHKIKKITLKIIKMKLYEFKPSLYKHSSFNN
jgi:hypothetical protein